MWSFFCHCVIEALLGDFFFSLSLPLPPQFFQKGSVIVKCCKGLGRGKRGGRGSVAGGGGVFI